MDGLKNTQANDETLFKYNLAPGLGELHCKFDETTGLSAIISINSLRNDTCLGGCRIIHYPSTSAALSDAKRLSQAMSYKSAMCDLPFGGGKAVILKPPGNFNRTALFKSFGRFIEGLQGRYITTVDSGSTLADIKIIGQETSYITAYEETDQHDPDPSPHTALGVFRGIEAALKFQLQKPLSDSHIAIQGLGNVGYYLAQHCHQAGARLTVTDINQQSVDRTVKAFNASAVPCNEIYSVDCDVFSPCALGAILNSTTIPQLKAKIVAGCANNQLASAADGSSLHERGILYAPDYIINAGGLIYVTIQYHEGHTELANDKIMGIYDTLTDLFEQAKTQQQATNIISDRIAAHRLQEHYQC